MDTQEQGFIEAIREDPTDVAAKMAYADWLQERNDLRGEYLSLECERRELQARLVQLQSQSSELSSTLDRDWLNLVTGLWWVRLVSYPANGKIRAIKLVRELTAYGLKKAKDLVELPTEQRIIRDAIPREEAEEIVEKFQGIGTVVIEPRRLTATDTCMQPPWRVRLLSCLPENKLATIKAVCDLLNVSLRQAKHLVDIAPENAVIRDNLWTLESAEVIAQRFQGIAEVLIEHSPE